MLDVLEVLVQRAEGRGEGLKEFTNINYPTITYQTRFQKRGQQLSIYLSRKPARVAFEVLCFVLVPFPVLFRLENIFS